MWTANSSNNSVTKVTSIGTMTTYTGTGVGPAGIAYDGTNMWTANFSAIVFLKLRRRYYYNNLFLLGRVPII